jgi:FAD/FMN-containing dehydrogenase
MTTAGDQLTWRNWAGNEQFAPGEIATPTTERELEELTQRAVSRGRSIGLAGTGHSFTPIVECADLLIKIEGVNGIISSNPARHTVDVLAGTTIEQMGQSCWDAGLSLKNQGDIDAQTIAGAVATGTHGSGIEFGSFSSTVRGARLVTGTGDVIDIDDSQPDLLHAAQVSIGVLGVITRLTLEVTPAYHLTESNRIDPLEKVLEQWDEEIEAHRHYSFFWASCDESGSLYGHPPYPANHCYVKMLDEVEIDPTVDQEQPIRGSVGARTGRAYLIYPDDSDENTGWIELEYMVDVHDAKPAFLALRALIQNRFPEEISPIEMRWTRGEPALLSPHHGHDTCSISVSGLQKHDWRRFLRAVDETLQPWAPRPHWGKVGFLDQERVRALYPRLDDFLAVRAQLDPNGLFLNDYFREVLGL